LRARSTTTTCSITLGSALSVLAVSLLQVLMYLYTMFSLGPSRCWRWPPRRTVGGCASWVGCREGCSPRRNAGPSTHQRGQSWDSRLPRATRRKRGIHTWAIIFMC
jgi:hypothetical protein